MKMNYLMILIYVFSSVFLIESASAAKKIYKYRKSQEHKFGGADVMGDGFDPSGTILNEEHPQTFDYIFNKKTKVIKKINQISKYAGRSL